MGCGASSGAAYLDHGDIPSVVVKMGQPDGGLPSLIRAAAGPWAPTPQVP